MAKSVNTSQYPLSMQFGLLFYDGDSKDRLVGLQVVSKQMIFYCRFKLIKG